MSGFVYILADVRRGRTYVGVTNDLQRRVYEHREGLTPGYTKQNSIKRLVYFEEHGEITDAIQREKNIKRWYRAWKAALIERDNPEWRDLWEGDRELGGCTPSISLTPRVILGLDPRRLYFGMARQT